MDMHVPDLHDVTTAKFRFGMNEDHSNLQTTSQQKKTCLCHLMLKQMFTYSFLPGIVSWNHCQWSHTGEPVEEDTLISIVCIQDID